MCKAHLAFLLQLIELRLEQRVSFSLFQGLLLRPTLVFRSLVHAFLTFGARLRRDGVRLVNAGNAAELGVVRLIEAETLAFARIDSYLGDRLWQITAAADLSWALHH